MEEWIAIGLVAILSFYIFLRTAFVPFTYDEAATFFHYVHTGKWWPGEAHWDANNHILNSLLTHLSYRLFGSSEIALRLPNALAGLLYLTFAFKLSFKIQRPMLRWVLFLSLTCSQFVLEFFGYSRGYGLSMGFLMMALYFMHQWLRTKGIGQLFLMTIAVQLATFANLSLVLVNVLVSSWVALRILMEPRSRNWAVASTFLLGALFLGLFVNISFELKKRGLLYYGQGEGFWDVTVSSLSNYGFYPWGNWVIYAVPFAMLLLLSVVVLNIKNQIRDRSLNTAILFFPYLFLGTIVSNLLLHILFNVNYPEDRVALHYLVLFPCALIFSMDALPRKSTRWMGGPASLLLLVFSINLVATANWSHSVLWERDASARMHYQKLLEKARTMENEPTVVGYRMRSLPFNYYNYRNNGMLSPIQASGYRTDEADYQIAYLEDDTDWSHYDTLLSDRWSGLYLMERRKKREREPIFDLQVPASGSSAAEFQPWFESNIDSLRGQDLLWDIEIEMPELTGPFIGWAVVTVEDSLRNELTYETIPLDWLKKSWNQGELFKHHILVPNIEEQAKWMKVYFWNIKKQPIKLGKVEIRLSKIRENHQNSSTLP